MGIRNLNSIQNFRSEIKSKTVHVCNIFLFYGRVNYIVETIIFFTFWCRKWFEKSLIKKNLCKK